MSDILDQIRFYHQEEVQPALAAIKDHPMVQAMLQFTFPQLSEGEIDALLADVNSIEDFQSKVIYHSITRILEDSSEGLSISGLDQLKSDETFLFISNHRDILLDTCLINYALLKNKMQLTASVIGDNLVNREVFMVLAKLNRNFLVKRDVSPRDLLENSKILSAYIQDLILDKKQSVWIAQREGRTKDGNDATHPGVLKMIAMANGKADVCEYFQKLNVVPVSISYEFDPTDKLKTYKAIQTKNDENVTKSKNEDFENVMAGVLGQKKKIHIHFGSPLTSELERIKTDSENNNQQIQAIAKAIDQQIISNYHLFPNNYIALDILNKSSDFATMYTQDEKDFFVRRMEMGIDKNDPEFLEHFLELYANPVRNKENLGATL